MASAINLLSYLKTPAIAVLVGPSGGHQQSFTVHEGLLTDRSQFFANALKPGRFKKGIERLVPLPDDAPEVFAIYAQILYLPDFLVSVDDLRGAECEQPYIGLCKLYVLVEKLMDDTTKAVVLKALERLTAVFGVPVRGTRIIYEATLEDDPARKMVVKGFTEHDTGAAIRALRDTDAGHPDLFRDIALSALEQRVLPKTFQEIKPGKTHKRERGVR